MLGLVTSSNLIQIYFFWELVGMCSYLLIGFWGFWSFRDLFKIANNWIPNNGINSLLTTFFISLIGTITLFLGATLALAQRDIKRSLAYSTMSQLGYMMLALGIGSYQAALFHLITHAYSKALLFLGSGSVIHSMEPLVGYSPDKSQNMVLMGGLRKYVPITRTTFLCGTLSLCGIPPLACFCNSWLYSPFFGIIASFTAGLTAFLCFGYIYLLLMGICVFIFKITVVLKKVRCIQYPYGEKSGVSFFSQNIPKIPANTRNKIGSFSTPFGAKNTFVYPHETGNTMLFPLLILLLFTLFIGSIGIHFDNGVKDNRILELTILSNLAIFGLFIAYIFYGSAYSFFQNLNFQNSLSFLDEGFYPRCH
ncbi:hypothetical protein ACJX0J_002109 [Zea mays]